MPFLKSALLFGLIFSATLSFSQDSFLKKITFAEGELTTRTLCNSPDGGFVISGFSGQIIKLDSQGEPIWGTWIHSNLEIIALSVGDDNSIFALVSGDVSGGQKYREVIKLDPNGNFLWKKVIGRNPTFYLNRLTATKDGGALASHVGSDLQGYFRYSKLSASGDLEWDRALYLYSQASAGAVMETRSGGEFLIGGYFGENPAGILVKANTNGQVIWGKTYTGFNIFSVHEFQNGEYLIYGSTALNREIVLARVSTQGEIIWAKSFLNDNNFNLGLPTVTPDDEVVFLNNLGDNLLALFKVKGNGDLLWSRGFWGANTFTDSPKVAPDGSIAFVFLGIHPDMTTFSVLVKAKPDGALESCQSLGFCVSLQNFDTKTGKLVWDYRTSTTEFEADISMMPINVTVKDTCAIPLRPVAAFQIPDTICAGESIQPTNIHPNYIGFWLWNFESGTPEFSTDHIPGAVLFDEPGNFTVQQKILLGECPDSLSKILTVLPNPPVHLGPDTLICEDKSYLLDGASPEVWAYLWENGSTSPQREVTANGIYTLLVADEKCHARDSVEVRFFDQTYPNAFFSLGSDTAFCKEDHPALTASAAGAGGYLWENGSTNPSMPLSYSGIYRASAYFENCPLSDEVEISLDVCGKYVYIPNAFSPNGDGVNDLFQPYGANALMINLKIFDRWGDKVFDTDHPESGWDGTKSSRPLDPGVYVYLLEYEDLIARRRELASGELLLLR